MSSVDLHPEDLLDRVRRGQATAAERERVQAHLQQCEACRFEEALLGQGLRDAAPHPGDAARARAIEAGVLAALAARSTKTAPRRRTGAWIAAALVSSIATAAAAAVITQPAWLEPLMPTRAAPPAPAPAKPKAKHRVALPAPEPAPPIAVAPEPLPGIEPAPHVTPRSAAELFAQANAARRDRPTQVAVRAYRELLRAHSRSQEALVARVALGRLLLDRAGDPRGALRELDAYLAAAPTGPLREEALVGRALALGRLGRADAERRAWRALLEAFPASASAERARARIEQLR